MTRQQNITAIVLLTLAGCTAKELRTEGQLERLDPALDNIVAPDAKAEIIAEGYKWSEGPLWIESQKMLVFSDVPNNTVFKWTEKDGASVYLSPSGYTGETPRGGEMGSNGLILNSDGNLVLCQHGNRQLAIMNAPLDAPKAEFKTVAGALDGKRFNSPNDVTQSDGYYYLTDPAYGLEKQWQDPAKELSFQGVYRISPDGKVQLLVDSISRPNGIAFFPDKKHFLVTCSDPGKATWSLYELGEPSADGQATIVSGKIFYDATSITATEKGLPDGLKIDSKGNVYSSGPGGVYFFNQDGKLLGKLKLADPCSNIALSDDEKTMYVTNNNKVLRMKLK